MCDTASYDKGVGNISKDIQWILANYCRQESSILI